MFLFYIDGQKISPNFFYGNSRPMKMAPLMSSFNVWIKIWIIYLHIWWNTCEALMDTTQSPQQPQLSARYCGLDLYTYLALARRSIPPYQAECWYCNNPPVQICHLSWSSQMLNLPTQLEDYPRLQWISQRQWQTLHPCLPPRWKKELEKKMIICLLMLSLTISRCK